MAIEDFMAASGMAKGIAVGMSRTGDVLRSTGERANFGTLAQW